MFLTKITSESGTKLFNIYGPEPADNWFKPAFTVSFLSAPFPVAPPIAITVLLSRMAKAGVANLDINDESVFTSFITTVCLSGAETVSTFAARKAGFPFRCFTRSKLHFTSDEVNLLPLTK